MMIDKRLIGTVSESKKYIAGSVLFQWCGLAANIALMGSIARLLAGLFLGRADGMLIRAALLTALAALAVRYLCTVAAARMSYLSSRMVKKVLREKIYQKLLRLGSSYRDQVQTSEIVQVAVEGVDQLETYFGAYLPQFFYAMLAPLTLFGVLSFADLPTALVLLVCVPLIPAAIAAVQRWAKKLLSKYWGQYTQLGDTFLEDLQGLTTLKIYGADGFKQEQMNRQAEQFRKITMRVLTMQLNSIAIMDLIAYGGAALGAVLAVIRFQSGKIGLESALLILLLAADFFLPMRLLGSYFHIAMNGMAASEKIFRLMELEEPRQGSSMPQSGRWEIQCKELTFGYEPGQTVLQKIDFELPQGGLIALAGESGCGKSTLAALLMGRNKGYTGSIRLGGAELSEIPEQELLKKITYVGCQNTIFKGTVRENLQMGCPGGTDAQFWQALEQVRLDGFLRAGQGLDTPLLEQGANLSGGQRQRLALARALLKDSPIYLFDEATSNIDVESEEAILDSIRRLAGKKTVLLISHRLANITGADRIYLMDKGRIAESGTHAALLACRGAYFRLWQAQQELEQYRNKGETA